MKFEKSEVIFFGLNLLASVFVAYLTVILQTSRDIERLRSDMTFQGKMEALRINRERTARRNDIQKRTEMAELLPQRFSEDSTSASDSIDVVFRKRIDSLKQNWASRGAYEGEGISGGRTFYEMDINKIKSACNTEKKIWVSNRRRVIEDLQLEVKWLKNLEVTDTLPIPAPSL